MTSNSERADSNETLLAMRIPERPGSFRELYEHISPRNVTEFSYRYNTAKQADVIVHQNHKNTFFLPSIRTSQIASRVEYVSRKIKLVHHQDHQDHHFQDQNAQHQPTSEV